MKNQIIVKTSYANIYKEPSFSSEMVTQALFYEKLITETENDSWIEVSQWDGYRGFVHKFYTTDQYYSNIKDIIITDRFTALYRDKSLSDVAMYVPFASSIISKKTDGNSLLIEVENVDYYCTLINKKIPNNCREKIVQYSRSLIGSPYLWGGKTPFGFDCSGFVQSVFRGSGFNLSRDTKDQIDDKRFESISIDESKPGDLIFFNMDGKKVDHVGIVLDSKSIIHCSGMVKQDSLDSSFLREHILDIKSIRGLLND